MMQRDNTIDILKAIGIILVVIGHSGFCGWGYNFIYSFHMPLFFIASGYFFNAKYLDNKKMYIKKKIQDLYIPFVKYSIIFLLLHNLFIDIGLLSESYGYLNAVSHYYDYKDIIRKTLNIVLRMSPSEYVLGAFWFLRSLFVGLILFMMSCFFLNKVFKDLKTSLIVCLLSFEILALILVYYPCIIIPQGGYRECLAVVFISLGYLIKNYWHQLLDSNYTLFVSIAMVIPMEYLHVSMGYTPQFKDWAFITLTGFCGFVLIYRLSKYINSLQNNLTAFLSDLGANSFYVLVFHFLMFKPISFFKTYIYKLPHEMIGCHPVVDYFTETDFWWIVYSISSLFLSLMLGKIVKCIPLLKK